MNITKTRFACISLVMFLLGAIFGGGIGGAVGFSAGQSSFPLSSISSESGGLALTADPGEGISLVSKTLSEEEYGTMAIAANAESVQRITATVTPVDAADAVLDWSVSWKEGTSGKWGSGKTVTDYITVTPTSDGALEADVACLQPFGEQIVITASIRGNASVKGTCTADYLNTISEAYISMDYAPAAQAKLLGAAETHWVLSDPNNTVLAFPQFSPKQSTFNNIAGFKNAYRMDYYTFSIKVKQSNIGTTTNYHLYMYVSYTDAYLNAVEKAGGDKSQLSAEFTKIDLFSNALSTYPESDFIINRPDTSVRGQLLFDNNGYWVNRESESNLTFFEFTDIISLPSGTNLTTFMSELKAHSSEEMIRLCFSSRSVPNEHDFVFHIKFDPDSFTTVKMSEAVAVDPENVTF